MALDPNALTTLATAMDELAIRDAAKAGPVERLINTASVLIAKYVGRVLQYGAVVTEQLPGYGTDILHMSRTPVLSIISVQLHGSTLPSEAYALKSAERGALFAPNGWQWTAPQAAGLIGSTRVAGAEQLAYTVTYSGGWVTPEQARLNQALTRTLPYDIEQACLYTVVHMHRQRGKFAAAVVETDEATADVWRGAGIPSVARAFLDPYRRAL